MSLPPLEPSPTLLFIPSSWGWVVGVVWRPEELHHDCDREVHVAITNGLSTSALRGAPGFITVAAGRRVEPSLMARTPPHFVTFRLRLAQRSRISPSPQARPILRPVLGATPVRWLHHDCVEPAHAAVIDGLRVSALRARYSSLILFGSSSLGSRRHFLRIPPFRSVPARLVQRGPSVR